MCRETVIPPFESHEPEVCHNDPGKMAFGCDKPSKDYSGHILVISLSYSGYYLSCILSQSL